MVAPPAPPDDAADTGVPDAPRDLDTPDPVARPVLALVACGWVDAERLPELRGVAGTLGAQACVLQGEGPSLSATLDRLAAQGAPSVRLVGVSTEGVAAGLSWVRRVAAHWLRASGSGLAVEVVPAIARSLDPGEVEVVASFDARPVTGTEAPLENPTWERVQAHRQHVLVCRGPRCTAKGSGDTVAALGEALWERGLLREDVLVATTGCLTPCNHSPVVVVHPEGEWYGPVDPDGARALVAARLDPAASGPVEPALLPRRVLRQG